MRDRDSGVITGPISLAGSMPGPTVTAVARSFTASTMASPAAPTATAAETAMHRSPAEPNAAAARWSAAKLTSASGRTIGVVLGAAEGLDALAVRRGPPVDVLRDRGGADERDRRDAGVVQQRVHGLLVTVHDVEDAVRQAGLPPQLGHEQRWRRVALARLEDEGVAAGDGNRVHPHGDHHREVERRDAGHHPERLAERVRVHVRGDLVREVAFEQMRYAAGELDDLQPSQHLATGVGEHLAVLAGDQLGQLVHGGVDELAEGEEHLRAPAQRRLGPLLECLEPTAYGVVDVLRAAQHHLPLLLPGRGVPHRCGAGRGARGGGAADPVLNGLHRRSSLTSGCAGGAVMRGVAAMRRGVGRPVRCTGRCRCGPGLSPEGAGGRSPRTGAGQGLCW